MTLTNQGLFGFNFNVSAEEPAPCTLTAPTLTNATTSFGKDGNAITEANAGDNITMTISPNAGYYLNTLTDENFNVIGGTKGTYENNVLNITYVTGNVTVSLQEGVTPTTLEEYNGTRLRVTGNVVMTNENITVDANLVTWANKSQTTPDNTVSYGDTVIIPVYSVGYTISGTPTITINNGAFQVTGAYSNGNVTFTMPDIGDNNAEITSLVIDGLTVSRIGYNRPFDNEAMRIYSNVPAPTDGTVNLTGLTAETDGHFEMKGDTGYYAEIIPPAPNATYKVELNLFGSTESDDSWYYYPDQQTIALINDASGKTTGIYFKVTPQYIYSEKYSLKFKITLTDVVIPAQPSTPSTPDPTPDPEPTASEQIKDKLDDTSAKPIEIAKTSNAEFKEIKAEAVLSKATDKQKEALKSMTAEQIQTEIKKAADAISTVNTTKISEKAKEKIEAVKKTLPADAKIMPINFTVHATFAFPVEVTIPVDKADYPDGAYYLYYYNEETGKLEDCGEATVDASGIATFTISHCSDYFISSKTVDLSATAVPEVTTPATAKNPKTGESNPIGTLSIFAILSVATLAVVSKKRKFKLIKK
jgi:LPXTG-motif cell wall-anchored protein